MSLFTFDFENGTNGVKVDVADTPSSGDTIFSGVTENTGSGGTCKYDNTQAAHGTKSLKIATGGTSVSSFVEWNTTGFGTTQYYRAYVYFTANPSGNIDVIQIRDSATRARLRINSTGKVVAVNGSTAVGTSTASIGLNQWVRLEYKWVANATTGILEAKIFNTPDSTTPDETLTVTSLNTGTTEATNTRIGMPIAGSNIGPFWLDDLGVTDVGYIGPPATNYTRTVDDATGLVDTRALAYGPAVADSTGLTDTMPSVGGSKVASATDSTGLTDSVTTASAMARTFSDAAGLTDVATGNKLGTYGAAALKFNFDNGTVGSRVAASDTPSVGDTAFSTTTENTSSGGQLKYDDTHAAHGTKSLKVATGATSTSSYVEWDTSGGGLTKYYRFAIWMDSIPVANRDIVQMRDSSTRFRLRVNTDGTLSVVLGSTAVATSTEQLPYGEWGRVEYREVVDSSAGSLTLRLFGADLEGETPVETITATGLNTGTLETTNVRIGIPVAAANFGPTWYDDLAVGYDDWLGPATGTVTLSGAFDDSLGLTDTVSAVAGNVVADSAGLTDSVTYVGSFVRTISESAGVTDTANAANGLSGGNLATDSTGLTDSIAIARTYRPSITDSEFVTETLATQDRATTGPGSGQNFYDVPFAFYDNQPGDAVIYNGTGSLGTAMANLAAGKWLVLDYDGDRVESINVALKNNVTIVAAEGRRPWLNGNFRMSAGEGVRIYGLNVRNDNIGGSDHMVKLDGGSPDWGYSIITLEDNAAGDGAYTLMRPGQAIHDWRIHHCWIHDNPGATGHNGSQDHGLYCSAENPNQRGVIDHCLIENMPEGRNIKVGGPSAGPAIGGITIQYCTLKNGQGPSNGQVSNGATGIIWEKLLLIDSGASTNLTEGSGAGSGNIYRNNKGDKTVGPATSNFSNGGGNTNSVSVPTLTNYSAQGLLGWGHLEGFTSGGTGGTDFANILGEQVRLSDILTVVKTGPAPQIFADALSFLNLTDEVSTQLIDTVIEQILSDDLAVFDDQDVISGTFVFLFTPPTLRRHYLLERPHPLLSRLSLDTGLSVIKTGSSYKTVQDPDTADIAASDEFYLGGRTYEVTQAQRDALSLAGYGSYIATIQR